MNVYGVGSDVYGVGSDVYWVGSDVYGVGSDVSNRHLVIYNAKLCNEQSPDSTFTKTECSLLQRCPLSRSFSVLLKENTCT